MKIGKKKVIVVGMNEKKFWKDFQKFLKNKTDNKKWQILIDNRMKVQSQHKWFRSLNLERIKEMRTEDFEKIGGCLQAVYTNNLPKGRLSM